jgi:FKBP-type peptidyl-prolyl cis-trans isomerase FkpA
MKYYLFIWLLLTSTIYSIELIGENEMENQKDPLTELKLVDNKVGDGREAEAGLVVKVHYTGWLYDSEKKDFKGKKFDSSLDRNDPLEFSLGIGQVIKGWDEGVQGMKIGGKRTIFIPSIMGYGSRGAGDVIPPNADLIFDVELLGLN